jgi:hypothetical protein
VDGTANILTLIVKEIFRQQSFSSKADKKTIQSVIDFCRRSLVAK